MKTDKRQIISNGAEIIRDADYSMNDTKIPLCVDVIE